MLCFLDCFYLTLINVAQSVRFKNFYIFERIIDRTSDVRRDTGILNFIGLNDLDSNQSEILLNTSMDLE